MPALRGRADAPAPARVVRLAAQYVALRTSYDPTLAVAVGLPIRDSLYLPDRSAGALRALHQREDALLAELRHVPATDTITAMYAVLREELESRQALRVCRSELWGLSHTQGWQVEFPALAGALPVTTSGQRRRMLALWRGLPRYLATDSANLHVGLVSGYTAPIAVVERVLEQLDAMTAGPSDASPFYAPALRTADSTFARNLRRLVADTITPAIRRYAAFLRTQYLPRARSSIGLSGMPHGNACYRAYLRRYTTTDDPPRAILNRGESLVAESTRELIAIGARRYGVSDVARTIERSRADSANRFRSPAELIAFSRRIVARAADASRALFTRIPVQQVVVEPLPAYQRGTGVSSHYQANADERAPATFWIASDDWRTETRGAAEITAVHETIPGHHLQIAAARGARDTTGLSAVTFNAAYVEGWANYAERLAEEHEIDSDDYERIQRRVLAGRSLVIDPGIHAFGWTRARAEAYAMKTGMSRGEADDVIDRIAVEPGQLTSYEMGGLELLALREFARHCLGDMFDIRRFHEQVLERGPVPLRTLRARIRAWARSQSRHRSCGA